MRLTSRSWALWVCLAGVSGAAAFVGCQAGISGAGGAGASGGAAATGTGGATATTSTGSGSTSTGFVTGSGGAGGGIDVPMNPCGTKCGPMELCDGVHKGIDDNCNGTVDEGCPCSPGEAESCFKGDPSYLNTPGCFPGSQKCSENGVWQACTGGNHATDMCFNADPNACHPISAVPFATVDLGTGTGNFENNADPGSSDWALTCPQGVTPCPTPDANGNVQVLVSGEYLVHYTKTVNGMPQSCDYPLYVGARGLRVELSWDYPAGSDVDLDLHMHQPATTTPWANETTGSGQDCGYNNCKISTFSPFTGSNAPNWFPTVQAMPGDPVSWFLDPVMNQNTCYFAPRGQGADWQTVGMGCHNPRLDLDNITCNPSINDPQDGNFCAPENINVDFPPKDQWIRVGVDYYSAHSFGGIIHPDVKIYCDGQLAADLGVHGFFSPETAVAWQPAQAKKLWLVADVKFTSDMCSKQCIVKPIYLNGDTVVRAPVYMDQATANGNFGPMYPP
jgi:hypothetical protein